MKNEIYPCLWFDGKARTAADYYIRLFQSGSIVEDNGMVVIFELHGKKYMGLNGGPRFPFTEAISFVIPCDTQEEIDYYWNTLVQDGGEESMCGWCKDKFGLSWQIVPSRLGEWVKEPQRAQRVFTALFAMRKLDIEILSNA